MSFALPDVFDILGRTPTVLAATLAGLPEAWVAADEGADTFSPRDVLGHLIGGEETDWIPRARTILEHGPDKPFEPFDRFAFRRLAGRTVPDLLEIFAILRAQNLATLRSFDLDPARLALVGRHPDFGKVTLRQLLATWVVHDLGHVAQITRVMSKRFTTEVGPWYAYLPVLHSRPKT